MLRAALRAHNGQYVVAEQGGGDRISANRERIHAWEIFEVLEHGVDQISLKTAKGQYVSAEGGGGRELTANREAIADWEVFRVLTVAPGNVALRASNSQFVCAEGGGTGTLVANREHVQAWEIFEFLPVDASGEILRISDAGFRDNAGLAAKHIFQKDKTGGEETCTACSGWHESSGVKLPEPMLERPPQLEQQQQSAPLVRPDWAGIERARESERTQRISRTV